MPATPRGFYRLQAADRNLCAPQVPLRSISGAFSRAETFRGFREAQLDARDRASRRSGDLGQC